MYVFILIQVSLETKWVTRRNIWRTNNNKVVCTRSFAGALSQTEVQSEFLRPKALKYTCAVELLTLLVIKEKSRRYHSSTEYMKN